MKRDKLYSLIWSVVLGCCIACGSISCLDTAFSLGLDMPGLVSFSLMCGAVLSLAALKKHGTWLTALALLVIGGMLWLFGGLDESVKALAYVISEVYDRAYGWGTLPSPLGGAMADPALAPMAIAAALVWVVTDMVMKRRPAIGGIAVGLLPLFACMVVTDTIPSADSLFVLFFGIALLVLTQSTRRRGENAGNRLTAILLIPALLATNLLFWAVPQEGDLPAQLLPGWIEGIFQQITDGTGQDAAAPVEKIELSQVGPKPKLTYAVMEVTAQQGGEFYFRGQSFDVYTGTSWEIAPELEGPDPYFPTMGLRDGGLVTVYLRMETDRQYLAYYTNRLQQLQFGRYENTGERTYSFQRLIPGPGGTRISGTVAQDAWVAQCLALPEDTRQWAEAMLEQIPIGEDSTATDQARIIADFVRNSAEYSRNAERMPAEQTDFARWFLEQGDRGYCVHFATAATVLLRAAGVPARYVTGYKATIGSTKTNVLADDSHAWVEYLDYTRGWTVLEPTPAEPEQEPTESTAPTEQTQPTDTQAPTQGSTLGPSQATDPSVATVPRETTGDTQEQPQGLTLLHSCLQALLHSCLTAAVLLGQYGLRLRLRRQKRRGRPNQKALALWKEIVHFSKLYRCPLPEELIALAEKAKFSQHTLSGQELHQFQAGLQALRATLQKMPWYRRLLFKLIFAAE